MRSRPIAFSLKLLVLYTLMVSVGYTSCAQTAEITSTFIEPDVGQQERITLTSAIPAFPGAEGFGANALGGRGGDVIEVTNLNDDGPGSLRAAINSEGPRIVVFRTGGTIELQSTLEIINPFITIAGQTAPGGGITLKNRSSSKGTLFVRTHDVVIRNLRSRPGPPAERSSNGDAIEILGPDAYNIIIDHCSFSWAIDEVVSTWYAAHNITIQWSIIAEGLNCSKHEKGCHSMGMLLGSEGSGNISIHHNLFAHNHQRNPFIKTSGLVDVVNNVIYNPWGTPSVATDDFGEVQVNYIANYFKRGADTASGKIPHQCRKPEWLRY